MSSIDFIELVATTRVNHNAGVGVIGSDAKLIQQGKSTDAENLCEYAGRVCYRSTEKMGTAPNFLRARVREGHEDIIEHANAVMRVTGKPFTSFNLDWLYSMNKHVNITFDSMNNVERRSYFVSANLRVWLDILRRRHDDFSESQFISIAPNIFKEFYNEDWKGEVHYYPPDMPEPTLPSKSRGDITVMQLAHTHRTQDFEWNARAANNHISVTFLIEGISRACTHQLVRHRLASFSQESQRYVDLKKGGWKPVIPPAVAKDKLLKARFEGACSLLNSTYRELRELGIRKEDARFLLPNATETRLVVTMNLSAWDHFIWLRAVDKAAQWEIREVGQMILEFLHGMYPPLFQSAYEVYQKNFAN